MRSGREADERGRGTDGRRDLEPDIPGKRSLVETLAGPTMANRQQPAYRGLGEETSHLGVGKQTLIERTFGHPAAVNPPEGGSTTAPEGPPGNIGPMQRKELAQGSGAAGPPPSGGGGAALPTDVRARMEAALGGSFAAVRVHEDAYAQAIGALAFTRGTDIFFAPGRFDPGSPRGLELIGHELTHVKQQAEGRVAVNAQIGGAPANNDPALEHEADELGAKAARGEAAPGALRPAGSQGAAASAPTSDAPAQAKPATEAPAADPPGNQPWVEELAGVPE